jgi:glutamyl-tRNA synthetase
MVADDPMAGGPHGMVRGRLAPSPTGSQHLGNARTYLLAWLSSRTQGGQVVLRIEDIDSPRVKPEATAQLFADLSWLGLEWDGPPVIQSQRIARYLAALEKLKQRELVYPCTCSRTDIENAASAPHAEHEGPFYPGTCAGRQVSDADRLHRPFAWRFRADSRDWTYRDEFRGLTTVPGGLLGDFVVWKNNNTPAYQLAVVVDDAELGVTEVVRGDDLVPSTPRQLMLFSALELTPPRYFHVPLVIGPDGRRLAKRHGDARLSSFRAAGISAEQILGFLACSCGLIEEFRPVTLRELQTQFDWQRISKEPYVLRPEPLLELRTVQR